MFMLVITVVAGFGVRRAVLGEGVSRNQLDYEVARQAAEAALRDAERDIMSAVGGPCARAAGSRPLTPDAVVQPHWDYTCPQGQCYTTAEELAAAVFGPAASAVPWWPATAGGQWGNPAAVPAATCTFNGGVPLGKFTGTPAIAGVARQPEYLIEFIAREDDPLLRVSARGFGADIRTEVVLQSYLRPPSFD